MATVADSAKRERSTIEFPYLDLDDAIAMAKGIHEVGGSACQVDQLAAHLKQAANGGGFRLRMIVARIFKLVRYDKGEISLTELGNRICDPIQERGARVEAFLSVELYKRIYEDFRGTVLPPAAGLENAMVSLGVAQKQKDKVRQTFMRAARQAGFFEYGAERLVKPSIKDVPQVQTQTVDRNVTASDEISERANSRIRQFHPFVEGLLQQLPDAGAEWPKESRGLWLQTAANIFDLMYRPATGDEQLQVSVKISQKENPVR